MQPNLFTPNLFTPNNFDLPMQTAQPIPKSVPYDRNKIHAQEKIYYEEVDYAKRLEEKSDMKILFSPFSSFFTSVNLFELTVDPNCQRITEQWRRDLKKNYEKELMNSENKKF